VIDTLYGLTAQISPDRPRYTLSAEVLPGVPWPKGFRQEINNWSVNFLGTWNVVGDDKAYRLGNVVVVSPRLYEKLRNESEQQFKPNLKKRYTEFN
jgi:hypothetical protein